MYVIYLVIVFINIELQLQDMDFIPVNVKDFKLKDDDVVVDNIKKMLYDGFVASIKIKNAGCLITDWIYMESYGIPKKKYPYILTPLDNTQKNCKYLRKAMKSIDKYMKKNIHDILCENDIPFKKVSYKPIVTKSSNNFKYMNMKLMVDYSRDNPSIDTQIYTLKSQSDNSPCRQYCNTVDDLTKWFNYQCTARFLLIIDRLWIKEINGNIECGVKVRVQQIAVIPNGKLLDIEELKLIKKKVDKKLCGHFSFDTNIISDTILTPVKDFNIKEIAIDNFINQRNIAYHRFPHRNNNPIYLQTDWIKMVSYGIPPLCRSNSDYYRSYIKIPLDDTQKGCMQLREAMETIDTYIQDNLDDIFNNGTTFNIKNYSYLPIVHKSNDKNRKDFVNMKFPIDSSYPHDHKINIDIFTLKTKNDTKPKLHKCTTVGEALKFVKGQCDVRFIFCIDKCWTQKINPTSKCGIGIYVKQIAVVAADKPRKNKINIKIYNIDVKSDTESSNDDSPPSYKNLSTCEEPPPTYEEARKL